MIIDLTEYKRGKDKKEREQAKKIFILRFKEYQEEMYELKEQKQNKDRKVVIS